MTPDTITSALPKHDAPPPVVAVDGSVATLTYCDLAAYSARTSRDLEALASVACVTSSCVDATPILGLPVERWPHVVTARIAPKSPVTTEPKPRR